MKSIINHVMGVFFFWSFIGVAYMIRFFSMRNPEAIVIPLYPFYIMGGAACLYTLYVFCAILRHLRHSK